jgi:hypothetical protein
MDAMSVGRLTWSDDPPAAVERLELRLADDLATQTRLTALSAGVDSATVLRAALMSKYRKEGDGDYGP